jgi:hypothetical protein
MNSTLEQALIDAEQFVADRPAGSHRSVEAQVAFHALMNIVRDHLNHEQRDAVIQVWVKGMSSEYSSAWNRGWDSGYDCAAKQEVTA